MEFSIVIPAYNEAENIGAAIKALLGQTVEKKFFEIIVVDNNSTDDTFASAEQAGADLVIKETRQGTNMARQAGLSRARGEIIAFLDADCLPPDDWLEKIADDLSDPAIAAISGPFDYGFTGLKKYLNEFYANFILPNVTAVLEFLFRRKSGILIGGNFAARRRAFSAIGGLPDLDFWGDDAAIAMLISRRAGPVRFDPRLVVKSSPRRFARTGFLKLALRYQREYFKTFFSEKYN
ncbi:MAG TPA: glycosyltransferase [Candidatus Nanoarchaeia archaeon]|nr:glycosyltransferase [Candidatus Nanoarchaeia archaeon]